MSEFSIAGDTRELDRIAERIGRLGRRDFQARLLSEMADKVVDLVALEFPVSHDPYGNPWAPLKRPRPGGGPLVRTGKLSRSFRRRVSLNSFTVSTRVRYAGFHQGGTRKMVARKFFPEAGQLPPRWLAELEQIADQAIRRAMSMAA